MGKKKKYPIGENRNKFIKISKRMTIKMRFLFYKCKHLIIFIGEDGNNLNIQ